jgi:hypothetical protein
MARALRGPIVRLDQASQLLCLPDGLPPAPSLAPDGSVAWQATVAARVEALHRLALQPCGPAAADPFAAGCLRHAALLVLLGHCVDVPEPATLELGLLSELLHAAALSEGADSTGTDFVAEAWRLRAVDSFVALLRLGDAHIGGATMGGALVPSWRIDSHVVPAIRRWVWSCATPLASSQLRLAVAAASEMFNECAVLLCRLDMRAGPRRRDSVMAVSMNLAAIWSVEALNGLRRRRVARAAAGSEVLSVANTLFAQACRRELATAAVAALRAVARLDADPALQRALRVFCARQYDLAVRSLADLVSFEAEAQPVLAPASRRSQPPEPSATPVRVESSAPDDPGRTH